MFLFLICYITLVEIERINISEKITKLKMEYLCNYHCVHFSVLVSNAVQYQSPMIIKAHRNKLELHRNEQKNPKSSHLSGAFKHRVKQNFHLTHIYMVLRNCPCEKCVSGHKYKRTSLFTNVFAHFFVSLPQLIQFSLKFIKRKEVYKDFLSILAVGKNDLE